MHSGSLGGGTSRKPRVNILGLSIFDRYFEGDREEIERMLAQCGIETGCFLAADCSLSEISGMRGADLNVVIDPQRGRETAEYLHKQFGTPYILCRTLPVGFEASEAFCTEICSALVEILSRKGSSEEDQIARFEQAETVRGEIFRAPDPSAVMEESRKARAYAFYKINGIYEMSGLPKGALFAVQGRFAQVFSYSAFFMDYLGMVPDALSVDGEMQPSMRKRLRELLAEYHSEGAMEKPLEATKAELVFGDANAITALLMRGAPDIPFSGIEISLPGMGYTDLVRKTHFGIRGAMFLTEQVLNGLMTRL